MKEVTKGPGRPQDINLRTKIIQAALKIIGKVGVERLTFEAVARVAGTSRPAIYRRWKKKEDLIAEAINTGRPHLVAPDTGSLQRDLRQAAATFIAYYSTPHARQAILAIISAANQDAAVASTWATRYGLPRIENFRAIFLRAIERGELDPHADIDTIMHVLSSTLLQTCLLSALNSHLQNEQRIDKIIDLIVH